MDIQTPTFIQNLKRKALKLIPSVKFWAFVAAGLLLAGQFGLAALACGAVAGLLFGRNQNLVSAYDAEDQLSGNDGDEDGYRHGPSGFGVYMGSSRVDAHTDD
jgi:hypothetical protein